MRRYKAVLLPLVVLAPACAETVAQPPAPPVNWASLEFRAPAPAPIQVTDRERAAAEGYLRALASPGFAALGPLLDEVAHFECGSMDTHGRERVIAAHEAVLGAFDRRSFATGRVWLTNDEKALEWVMTGVKAQKPSTLRGLTLLWTKDDASISDIHVYFANAGEPPGGKPRVYEKSGAPGETANVGLMRSLVHALQDDKESEFLAPLSDDVDAFGGHGREPARAWFRSTRRSMAQLDTAIESAWGVEDFAVVEYAISGRQLDRTVRVGVVDIGEIHNARITRIWRYDSPGATAIETRTGR